MGWKQSRKDFNKALCLASWWRFYTEQKREWMGKKWLKMKDGEMKLKEIVFEGKTLDL